MGALLAYCLEGPLDNFHHEYMAQFTDPRLKFKFKSSSPRYNFGIWSDAFTNQCETQQSANSRGKNVQKSSTTPGLKHLKPGLKVIVRISPKKDMIDNGNEVQDFDCPWQSVWESMQAFNEVLVDVADKDEIAQAAASFENFDLTEEPSFTVIKSSSGLAISGSGPVANAAKSKLTMARSRPVLENPENADVNTGGASALEIGDCNMDPEKNKDQQEDQNVVEMSELVNIVNQQF